MDFKSMNRKDLQALCKEHGLSANSTNSQMIESLSSIFQENIKPKGCLKGSGGSSAEDLGILRGGAKKVTFVIQDEAEDDFDEFTVKPVGDSKRKSVGRRSSVAPELEKKSEKTEKDSRSESLKDATEVPRRTTRSRGLAEAGSWSPVVEKKKKSGDGTEGVPQNATSKEKGIFGEVPVTRSLRNRAVVVGGDEVSVTDRNPRRSQKRKNIDKKEENEKAAALLVEDEAVGRKNLRKRSRERDSVEDEPPPRRSSRAKSEETVATEEIDVEKSKKRRKGGTETPLIEKVVADDTERISKPGGNAKRSRGNVLDGNAMGSGDVNDVAGQKKARSQQNNRASTQGDSTDSISDGEAVTGPTWRSTRSSSALLEVGNSVSDVGKSDQEGEAVRKSKFQKGRASKGAESASLLLDSEVVIEPVKRSTRSSSTLLEYGTSIPVGGKSAEGGEVVRKGKSLKQVKDHNSKGGSTFLMLDNEVVAEPVRRSTRSSSTLLLDGTSLPVVGKSVKGGEVVRKGKSQKQVKDVGSKGGSTTSLPDNEVAAKSPRRSIRSSSTLFEDGTSLPVVGKLVKGGKVDGKGKSQKQVKDDGANGGGSTTSLPDCEVVAEPPRRSTRSSSTLLEDATSLPVVGKSVKGGEAVRKGKSQKQAKDHGSTGGGSTTSLPESEVIAEPVRRSTRSSSSLLENVTSLPVLGKSVKESEAVRKGKSPKQAKDHASGGGVSTASLSDNEVIAESTRRLTRSSSKLLEDESHLSAVGKSGGPGKEWKQQKDRSSKQGDSTALLPVTETVTTPTRRLTRSSSKCFSNETVSPVVGKLGDTVSQENSCEQPRDPASGRPLLDDRVVTTPTRRSTRSSSKLLEDETLLKTETLGNDNEVRKAKSGKQSKNCALKLGGSTCPVLHNEAVMTPARRSTRSSSKLLEDGILLEIGKLIDGNDAIVRKDKSGNKSKNSALKPGEIVGGCGSRGAMEVGSTSSQRKSSRKAPADSGVMQRQCSPDPASSLLEDIQNNSYVKGKSSGKKQSNIKQSSHMLDREVDIRTSIGCHTLEEQDIGSDNKVAASKSRAAIAAEEISLPGPPTAALSFSLSIAVESNSGETEFSNDVDDKVISEMRQSPANVQFQKIENNTSFVGALKDLDDVCLGSNTKEKQSSFMEIAIKGKGELPLNITEGSSEIQENVSRKVDTTLEAEGTLQSYGDDSSKAQVPVEGELPLKITASSSEIQENVLRKVDTTLEAGRTLESCGDDSGKAPPPVDPTSTINVNSGKTSVGALDDVDGLAGMESQNFTSQPLSLLSSEELSTIFHTEISAMAHLKESDTAEEVDVVCGDIMTDHGARQIMTPRFPHSSDEHSPASDIESSPGLAHEESNLEVEICSATEDGLAGNVATNISGPISVCKRYEEMSPTLNTDASPEVDLEEPESKVKVDGPSEDAMAGSRATKIIDPVTSGIEVCPEAYCDTNVEKSDSEVEVHVANKGGMEGIEATKTAVSPFSCKSGEVLSPTLLPSLFSEVSPNIDLREPDLEVETHAMSKMASRSNDFLGEASATSSKTLEVLVTANRDAGDSSHIQRTFDNEMDSCKADPDNILNAQLASGACDVRKTLEASAGNSDSQLEVIKETWVSSTLTVTVNDDIETEEGANDVEKNEDDSDLQLEVIKETWVSSTLSVTVNDGIETEDGTNDVEKNEDELRPSSPSDYPAFDARCIPTCGVIETPRTLGCEGSTKQGGMHDFPYVPDSEDSRHLSDQHGGALNVTESLGVDSVDRSPKSATKEHEALEQLNGVVDILPETANIANELTDVEFEKGLELGAVDAEEMENIESLESEASIEGDNDTVMKKENTIELDKFDHFDEVGQTRDEAFFLQEVKGSSGELHTDDAHSHPSLENSAFMPGEVRLPSLENFPSSTYMENAPTPSLPKMDAISSVEELLNKDNTEKASAEEEILYNEEFLSPVSFSLLANRKETQDSAMLKKNTSSGGSLGLAASPVTNLADSHEVGGKSNDGKEVGAKMELRLLCDVHEELDNEKGQLAALTQSNEEERAQVSPIKFESVLEAREEHMQLSTSKSTYLIPIETFKREDYNTRTVYVTAISEPGSADADNANNDNDLLEENSDYNTITSSPKLAKAEHGVDHIINMSVSARAQDSVVTGISENSEASPAGDQSLVVADSSSKSQTQGTLECFEHGSNVEKAWVAPGATQMFVEDLFHMDSKVASFVKDGAQVGRVEHHEENLAHGKCENLLEVNTAETLATEEPEFKAIAALGSSDAQSQEASPFECEMSPTAENFSGGSAKPCADMDSQATHSTEQSKGQEERKIFTQETSEVSKLTKDEIFTVFDGIKTEGSATVVSKSETTEITPIPKAAKQEEMIARNCTELPGTNVAHHVVLWDWKESLGKERRPIGNELVSKFSGTSTAQHALVSLESGAVGGNSTAVQEENISKDEIMAHEYFGDFGWAFADDVHIGSSRHEVQDVDSQLPAESAQGNSADHSSKSGIDMNEEQNKSSELDQIEDSTECVQSTPMQLDINVKPCSVIDDVIRNKENTVGLKMDSVLRHNEKPKISNCSRRPLQNVRRIEDEH